MKSRILDYLGPLCSACLCDSHSGPAIHSFKCLLQVSSPPFARESPAHWLKYKPTLLVWAVYHLHLGGGMGVCWPCHPISPYRKENCQFRKSLNPGHGREWWLRFQVRSTRLRFHPGYMLCELQQTAQLLWACLGSKNDN